MALSTFKRHIPGIIALMFCFVQIVACVAQANYGQDFFKLSGATSGKVELAMCLAMCMPFVFFECLNKKTNNEKNFVTRIIQAVSLLCLLLSATLLILTESRASWLASFVGCCYVGYATLIKSKFTIKRWQKLIMIIILCIGSIALYYIRTDSANGRILIWKITTTELINGNITLLPRQGNFSTFIGDAQERYFSKKERPVTEQMLAGAPNYAYNEYLQIIVEWGVLIAFGVLCLITCLSIKLSRTKTENNVPFIGCFITIAIMSCFSYPFRCTTSLLVTFCIITGAIYLIITRTSLKMGFITISTLSIICSFVFRFRQDFLELKALEQCRQIDLMCTYDEPTKYLHRYEHLIPVIGKNPELMLAYAKALYDSEKYISAIMCLHKAQSVSGAPVLYLVEGKCRQKQKLYSKAEDLYKKAYYRIPHKIYPLYLLMNLYLEQRNINQAKETAGKIIHTHPKIESPEFDFIQNEAKTIYNTSSLN